MTKKFKDYVDKRLSKEEKLEIEKEADQEIEFLKIRNKKGYFPAHIEHDLNSYLIHTLSEIVELQRLILELSENSPIPMTTIELHVSKLFNEELIKRLRAIS